MTRQVSSGKWLGHAVSFSHVLLFLLWLWCRGSSAFAHVSSTDELLTHRDVLPRVASKGPLLCVAAGQRAFLLLLQGSAGCLCPMVICWVGRHWFQERTGSQCSGLCTQAAPLWVSVTPLVDELALGPAVGMRLVLGIACWQMVGGARWLGEHRVCENCPEAQFCGVVLAFRQRSKACPGRKSAPDLLF